MPTILVTGATGTVGSSTVRSLAARPGVAVRAAVHVRPAGPLPDNVQAVRVDYDEPETVRAAAAGVDAAFLITSGLSNEAELAERVLDALQAAGVPRLVRLSVLGAERADGYLYERVHNAAEQRIVASGLPCTFLRPNAFMSNFLAFFAPDPEGIMRLPWGDARVSHIDPRDVADVAAHVLTTEGHVGKVYTLTGPRALTASEVAEAIAAVTGRRIVYEDVPEEAVRQAMLDGGLPSPVVDYLLDVHAAHKSGELAMVTQTVTELLGRPARSFQQFAADHAAVWKTG